MGGFERLNEFQNNFAGRKFQTIADAGIGHGDGRSIRLTGQFSGLSGFRRLGRFFDQGLQFVRRPTFAVVAVLRRTVRRAINAREP